MAALAAGTLVLAGQPNTADKVGSLLIHMMLGGLAGMLVIARIVMRKREVLTIDEDKLLSEIDGTVMKMVRDSGCEAVLHRSKWKYQ